MIIWGPALHIIFVVMVNLAVGMTTFLVVTLYSNFLFGLAAGIFSFLTVLNSVRIRGFSLAPVFPGRSWSVFFLIVCVGASLFYGLMHWEWSTPVADKLGFSWSQQSDSVYSCSISEGPFYSKRGNSFIRIKGIVPLDKGFLTGKKDSEKGRPTMVEVRLGDSVTGECYWVPVGRILEKSASSSAGGGKGGDETKTQPGVVVLTPGDIRKQDVHKSSTRMMIAFTEFRKGDQVELMEDFSWQVAGDNPSTVVWVGGNQRIYELKGNRGVIEKGVRFAFKDEYINLSLNSSGNLGGFSELKLKKIKNLL